MVWALGEVLELVGRRLCFAQMSMAALVVGAEPVVDAEPVVGAEPVAGAELVFDGEAAG